MLTIVAGILSVFIGLGANSLKLYHNLPTAEISPWSAQWYQLCAERFRSFDRQTGLYVGLDGKKHFCRFAKKKVAK